MIYNNEQELAALQSVKQCSCGCDTVEMIEPCEVRCPECGEYAEGLTWMESIRRWNDDNAGNPPAGNIIGGFV